MGETRRELGRVETGESGGVRVVTGELEPGEATGTPVIAAALAEAGDAPGLHRHRLPAGQLLRGHGERAGRGTTASTVTEPTAFGLHDLRLVAELMRVIKKRCGVVVNKSGAGIRSWSAFWPGRAYPSWRGYPTARSWRGSAHRGVWPMRRTPGRGSFSDSLLGRIEVRARG